MHFYFSDGLFYFIYGFIVFLKHLYSVYTVFIYFFFGSNKKKNDLCNESGVIGGGKFKCQKGKEIKNFTKCLHKQLLCI